MKDYFKILQVPRTATGDEVKKSYHNLAKQLHPDKNPAPDAAERFQDLQAAYDTLKNDSDRDLYRRRIENLERVEKENANRPPPPPPSQTQSTSSNSNQGNKTSSNNNYQQPKYTFMKDEAPKGKTSSSQQSTTNGRASYFGEDSKAKAKAGQQAGKQSSKPGGKTSFFFARPRSNFGAFGDVEDDIEDAFFSSRDFFRAAFDAFTDDSPFDHAFEKFFSAAFSSPKQAPKQQQQTWKPSATKARKSATARKAASDDEDEDLEDEINNKRKPSFFFQNDAASPGPARRHSLFSSRPRAQQMGRFIDEVGDDDDDFDLPHPRFGRPVGKFGAKSRKNEEGFISFDDENPNLLLKCRHCAQKMPAEKFEQHEAHCMGFKAPSQTTEPPRRGPVNAPKSGFGARKPAAAGRSMTPPLVTETGGFASGQGAPAPRPRKQWNFSNKTTF